ncbi:MAG: M13 family metallopeptidase [Prevotella sp.]|nr:M13 family metallopeptidase [Prevotella sp.]
MKTILLSVLLGIGLTVSAQNHLGSVDTANFDANVSAKTDFYRHVNNGWLQKHPLPAERSRFGQFDVLNDTSNARIKDIVLGLSASNPQKGTVAYLVSTLYNLALDSTRRNAEGNLPIQPVLKKIENTSKAELPQLIYFMHKNYGNPFFSVGFQEDLANSKVYAMYVGSTSLGMGDRDYYLLNDKENLKVRKAYIRLIEKQMVNAGYSKKDAKRIAANVMKIETEMAKAALTREESRNIPAMYNPRTLAQLKELYPSIDWEAYFPAVMGFEAPEKVIVTELKSMEKANELLSTLSEREMKDYMLWDYVSSASGSLSDAFTDTNFEFSKVLSGATQQRPRWKRALGTVEGLLGEALGQLYVERYFPASSKEYMVGLVEDLRDALAQHIMNLEWMSPETKVQAMRKLYNITVKIGYPDKWKDYTTMELDPEKSFYENRHNATMWHQNEMLKKWGKPVDKSEWGMTPQTINAYYNPVANEIVFPAGILQAPFFSPESSDAENYGGIGVVIGHELTHGFDDQGRNFDSEGNMTNWWTKEDTEAFEKLTKGLVDQFNAVEILPAEKGQPALMGNGSYTLGENIADQGGLRIGYTAFLNSQKRKGIDINSEAALIDGFTPTQAFYLNFANLWAQNIRTAEMRRLTVGDVHSLGENRVNVSLRNIAPFFDAFGIKEGDKMYRPASERVIIW